MATIPALQATTEQLQNLLSNETDFTKA